MEFLTKNMENLLTIINKNNLVMLSLLDIKQYDALSDNDKKKVK